MLITVHDRDVAMKDDFSGRLVIDVLPSSLLSLSPVLLFPCASFYIAPSRSGQLVTWACARS
eukprot:3198198-Rhodomonas_salina.1